MKIATSPRVGWLPKIRPGISGRLKGSEYLLMQSQKDKLEFVKETVKTQIGKDQHLIVKKDRKEKVEGDFHLTVVKALKQKVDGKYSLKVAQDILLATDANHGLKAVQGISSEAGMAISFKAGTEVLSNPMDLRTTRRAVARLKTILAERTRAGKGS